MRIRRFTRLQRVFHLLLMICFFVQATTGIGRMYMETSFGQILLAPFGGFNNALIWHQWFGILLLFLFALHLIYLLILIPRIGKKSLSGPDSIMPRIMDLRLAWEHLRWMLGRKELPPFERWAYWEKFDYWAVFWGMVIIGGTGLILYNPLASATIMPGWIINVAFWAHRIEAILAIAHVFLIHFAIAHLRRHNFPMDRTIFTGSADLQAMHEEKSAWISRLKSEHRLQMHIVQDAALPARIASYSVGFLAIFLGLYIVIGGVINFRYVTW